MLRQLLRLPTLGPWVCTLLEIPLGVFVGIDRELPTVLPQ
jgi:hypothetical protein